MGKVSNNAMWIIGCKIVKAILTLLVTMLTARYLGRENFGLISYAESVVTFMTPIMKLGIDSVLVYEIVKYPDEEGKTLGTSILLNVISSLFCIIGVLTFVYFVNANETDTLLVCGLYSTLLVFQAFEMIQYWFQVKLKSKYTAIAMLIAYAVITVFQIILLCLKKNVYWFALSHPIEYWIISILLYIVYKRSSNQKLEFSADAAKRIFSTSKYYIVSSLMITVFQQTDRVMLKLMVGNTEVGIYSAAATCASMTSFVFAAIIDSMRPVLFENAKESKALFEKTLKNLYTFIIYSSLSVSLMISLLSPIIIGILYGTQYHAASTVLSIVVWYTTFSYLGVVRNIWILENKAQKYLWRINLLAACVNIAVNALLIPPFGATGAAIASLITQFFANVVLGFVISDLKDNNKIMIESLTNKQFLVLLLERIKQLIVNRR